MIFPTWVNKETVRNNKDTMKSDKPTDLLNISILSFPFIFHFSQ